MSAEETILVDGPLFVTWNRYGSDVLVVALAGELDGANVETARRAIADAGSEAEEEILVVDLSALEFIDSAGIALLVSLAEFGGDGANLRIIPSDAPAVSRIMRVTGVDSMLQMAGERAWSP